MRLNISKNEGTKANWGTPLGKKVQDILILVHQHNKRFPSISDKKKFTGIFFIFALKFMTNWPYYVLLLMEKTISLPPL